MTSAPSSRNEIPHASGFCVLAPEMDLHAIRGIFLEAIAVRSLEEALATTVVQHDRGGSAIAIDGSWTFIGVVSTSDSDLTNARDRISALSSLQGTEISFLQLAKVKPADRFTEAAKWLNQALLQIGEELLYDVGNVRRALVTLRLEHEEALERFAALEAYAHHFSTPQRISKLHLPPSSKTIDMNAIEGAPARIRQVLPIQTLGLAAIDLYVDAAPNGEKGELEIDLVVGSTSSSIYKWKLSAQQIVNGVNSFRLEYALDTRERDPVIDVRWTGVEPLRLFFGPANPIPNFCAAVEHGHRAIAPLALRAWGGLPGSPVAAIARSNVSTTATHSAANPVFSFALGSNDLRSATLLHPRNFDVTWSMVEFREAQLDLLVHPHSGGITVAVAREVSIRALKHLSALVLLDHDDARPVEFSLGAVARDYRADPQDLPKIWTRVQPKVFTEVEGSVDVGEAESATLFFATRMADNADATLAWAYFKRVEVTV